MDVAALSEHDPEAAALAGVDRERALLEARVSYVASHDALTGLPNRALLREHLVFAASRGRRTGSAIALLHLGLDAFRLVNASLGRAGGDAVLRAVTSRVQDTVRATDVLARPGSDELLLLLADLGADAETVAEQTATRVLAALEAPFDVGGAEFQLGASVGISLLPGDATEPDELLDHAESALYRAKGLARGGWAHHVRNDRDPLQHLSMSTRLRRALARDEFVLHYQPIFRVAPGEAPIGVEALLRWQDPELGLIPPGDFIPLAEETGLIEAIGDWVVGAVCKQQVEWARLGLRPMISFNVSPRQLRRLDFTQRVTEHLQRTGADRERLLVELTESTTMEDPMGSESILRDLHALGLRLAIDDFGSGHSSLARLREMPVETVKIDRAFLREVPENREAAAVVTAILRLSTALGRTAVAEGVETAAQHAFLVEEGCPLAQGFLLSRPVPAADIPALLQQVSSVSVEP